MVTRLRNESINNTYSQEASKIWEILKLLLLLGGEGAVACITGIFFQNNVKHPPIFDHPSAAASPQAPLGSPSFASNPLSAGHQHCVWPPSSLLSTIRSLRAYFLCIHHCIPTESRTQEWQWQHLTIARPLWCRECSQTPSVWYSGAPGVRLVEMTLTIRQLVN